MEEVIKNAEDLHKTRNYIINALEGKEDIEETESDEKIQELKKEPNFGWLFKNENGQKELENFISQVNDVREDIGDDSNLKYIPPALLNKIFCKQNIV